MSSKSKSKFLFDLDAPKSVYIQYFLMIVFFGMTSYGYTLDSNIKISSAGLNEAILKGKHSSNRVPRSQDDFTCNRAVYQDTTPCGKDFHLVPAYDKCLRLTDKTTNFNKTSCDIYRKRQAENFFTLAEPRSEGEIRATHNVLFKKYGGYDKVWIGVKGGKECVTCTCQMYRYLTDNMQLENGTNNCSINSYFTTGKPDGAADQSCTLMVQGYEGKWDDETCVIKIKQYQRKHLCSYKQEPTHLNSRLIYDRSTSQHVGDQFTLQANIITPGIDDLRLHLKNDSDRRIFKTYDFSFPTNGKVTLNRDYPDCLIKSEITDVYKMSKNVKEKCMLQLTIRLIFDAQAYWNGVSFLWSYKNYNDKTKIVPGKKVSTKFSPVPPGEAHLDVMWPGVPGEIWAGVPLKASCTAFVGSRRCNQGEKSCKSVPSLEWNLNANTSESSATWQVNFASESQAVGATSVRLGRTYPDREKCPTSHVADIELGVCFRVVMKPRLTWAEAQRFCKSSFNYNLASIVSKRHFHALKNATVNTDDENFYVDVNDIEQEGHFVKYNGEQVKIPDELLPWTISDASKKDCGVINNKGFDMNNCSLELPFICMSEDKTLQSPNNFDSVKGNLLTSLIEVTPEKALEGATLQCSSFPVDCNLPPGVDRDNLTSAQSEKFVFKKGQTKPILDVQEVIAGDNMTVKVTCQALVGSNGAMTLEVTNRWGKTTGIWVVNGSDTYDIKTVRRDKDAEIEKAEMRENEHQGRRVKATVAVRLSDKTNCANVSCYSYDRTNPYTPIESHLSQADLRTSHLITLKHLRTLSLKIVARFLNYTLGDRFDLVDWLNTEPVSSARSNDDGRSSSNNLLYATLGTLGTTGLLIMLLPKRRNERTQVVREGEDQVVVEHVVETQTEYVSDKDDTEVGGNSSVAVPEADA